MNTKKANEVIRYVDREDVEKRIHSYGYVKGNELNGIEIHFDKRGNLEEDESKLQVIPYVVLEYGNRILVYKRSGTEERLLGQLSIGFGGHSNKEDKTVLDTAIREIEEELSMKLNSNTLKNAGYIFSNSTPVSKVHIGYVYKYTLSYKELSALKVSDEIELAFLMDKNEIVKNNISKWSRLELENWSQLYIESIKSI